MLSGIHRGTGAIGHHTGMHGNHITGITITGIIITGTTIIMDIIVVIAFTVIPAGTTFITPPDVQTLHM